MPKRVRIERIVPADLADVVETMTDHLRKFESLLTRESCFSTGSAAQLMPSHAATNANDRACV